jgi:hypothetical protein
MVPNEPSEPSGLPNVHPHTSAANESEQQFYAWRQLCVCDRCEDEIPLINMAQWEFKGWESGISWCRKCFQLRQFKTERNTGPRVPDKKKQAQVNTCIQMILAQHPVSWSECMTCIDAEFPDPTETCKFLQSDAKRVPKQSVGKSFELVRTFAHVQCLELLLRTRMFWQLVTHSLQVCFASLPVRRENAVHSANQSGKQRSRMRFSAPELLRCVRFWHPPAGFSRHIQDRA